MADDDKNINTPVATPPAAAPDAAPENMMKILGYYVEPAEQEKLPNPEGGEDPAPDPTPDPAPDPAADQAPEPSADPAADPAPEGEPAPTPAPPANRARKLPADDEPALTRQELDDAVRKAVQSTKPATEDPLAKYGKLAPNERRALELAEFAAKQMPDRYADMLDRELEFIGKNRAKIAEITEANGSFDPNDESYQEFIRRARPGYQPGDREELVITRAEIRGAERAREEIRPQLEEHRRQLNEVKAAPLIKETLSAVEVDVFSVLDKPIAEALKANPGLAAKNFGVEAPLAMIIVEETKNNVREYLAISKGVREYDRGDSTHRLLLDFVKKQGSILDTVPEEKRTRNGKLLVSREAFAKIPENRRGNVVTFTDMDVVDMLTAAGKNYLKGAITAERTRLENAGYKKVGSPAVAATPKTTVPAEPKAAVLTPPKPAAAPKPALPSAPKGGVTAAPGAGGGVKAPVKPPVSPILKNLGYG
jgi:hypothetical protein